MSRTLLLHPQGGKKGVRGTSGYELRADLVRAAVNLPHVDHVVVHAPHQLVEGRDVFERRRHRARICMCSRARFV